MEASIPECTGSASLSVSLTAEDTSSTTSCQPPNIITGSEHSPQTTYCTRSQPLFSDSQPVSAQSDVQPVLYSYISPYEQASEHLPLVRCQHFKSMSSEDDVCGLSDIDYADSVLSERTKQSCVTEEEQDYESQSATTDGATRFGSLLSQKYYRNDRKKERLDTTTESFETRNNCQALLVDETKDMEGVTMEMHDICPSQICSGSDGSSSGHDTYKATQGPLGSQTDSSQDLGYSSFQGHENAIPAQHQSLTPGDERFIDFVDDWGNCGNMYLNREEELDKLLQQFERFFTTRFEMELVHFQDSVKTILLEQQNHIRQIVRIGTREQRSQCSLEDLIEVDEVGGSSCLPSVDNQTPVTADRKPCSCIKTAPPPLPPEVDDTRISVKEKLLELMSLSCAVSTLLTRKEYRA